MTGGTNTSRERRGAATAKATIANIVKKKRFREADMILRIVVGRRCADNLASAGAISSAPGLYLYRSEDDCRGLADGDLFP